MDLATLAGRGVALARNDVDCWVFARLHSLLKPRHWDVLVARYSTHKARKVQAIGQLSPLIASHAPRLFIQKAVTAWAIPPLKGADGKRSTDMIVLKDIFYDMNTWDPESRPESTRRRWRGDIRKKLDEMEEEAVIAAGEILNAEGLVFDEVA